MNLQETELIAEIKQAVHQIDPMAEIILYGSRARGDARPDSDWDLLILVEQPLQDVQTPIERALYRLELDTGSILIPIIHTKEYWASTRAQAMPFHDCVNSQGVRV